MNLKNRMYRVKDAYLAPEVDEEFINGSPYGERSPKYNTFDYNEKCAIQRCKEQGGEWMVFIENIGGEPSYDFGMSDGLKVDEIFNAWGEIPSRVLEIVENRNGKVYVEGVSEDVTTIPERNYVEDSRRVKDSRKVSDSEDTVRAAIQEMLVERGLDNEVDINDVDILYYGEDSDEVAEAELCNGCVCHVFQDEQDAYDFVKNPDNVEFTDYLEGAQSDEEWVDYLINGGVDADEAEELVASGNWQRIKEIILDSDGAEWFLGEYGGDRFYPEVGYVIYF